MFAMTAAHKTLPIPAYARVTNLDNQRSIVVRINDRGPFHDGRIIDLSYVAAEKLGIARGGTGFVEVRTVEPSLASTLAGNNARQNDIYLQIGAFSDLRNAQQLKNKLAAHSLPQSRIKSDTRNAVTLHKVLLGPLASAEDADSLMVKLATLGITQTRYVTENN
jgi:rare lipoprotein A